MHWNRVRKYLLSFRKRAWDLADYPVEIRPQSGAGPAAPAIMPWRAQIARDSCRYQPGLGDTGEAACADLAARLAALQGERQPCCPGPASACPSPSGAPWPGLSLSCGGRGLLPADPRYVGQAAYSSSRMATTLGDFLMDADLEPVFARIEAAYGVDVRDVEDRLLAPDLRRASPPRGQSGRRRALTQVRPAPRRGMPPSARPAPARTAAASGHPPSAPGPAAAGAARPPASRAGRPSMTTVKRRRPARAACASRRRRGRGVGREEPRALIEVGREQQRQPPAIGDSAPDRAPPPPPPPRSACAVSSARVAQPRTRNPAPMSASAPASARRDRAAAAGRPRARSPPAEPPQRHDRQGDEQRVGGQQVALAPLVAADRARPLNVLMIRTCSRT